MGGVKKQLEEVYFHTIKSILNLWYMMMIF